MSHCHLTYLNAQKYYLIPNLTHLSQCTLDNTCEATLGDDDMPYVQGIPYSESKRIWFCAVLQVALFLHCQEKDVNDYTPRFIALYTYRQLRDLRLNKGSEQLNFKLFYSNE